MQINKRENMNVLCLQACGLALEEAKATLVLSIFFVSCEEKDCYRDFSG